jgi:hypothetical protein
VTAYNVDRRQKFLQYRAGRLCSESCRRAGRLVVKPIEMGLAEIVSAISAELMVFDGSAEDIVSEAMQQLGLEARPVQIPALAPTVPVGHFAAATGGSWGATSSTGPASSSGALHRQSGRAPSTASGRAPSTASSGESSPGGPRQIRATME